MLSLFFSPHICFSNCSSLFDILPNYSLQHLQLTMLRLNSTFINCPLSLYSYSLQGLLISKPPRPPSALYSAFRGLTLAPVISPYSVNSSPFWHPCGEWMTFFLTLLLTTNLFQGKTSDYLLPAELFFSLEIWNCSTTTPISFSPCIFIFNHNKLLFLLMCQLSKMPIFQYFFNM